MPTEPGHEFDWQQTDTDLPTFGWAESLDPTDAAAIFETLRRTRQQPDDFDRPELTDTLLIVEGLGQRRIFGSPDPVVAETAWIVCHPADLMEVRP